MPFVSRYDQVGANYDIPTPTKESPCDLVDAASVGRRRPAAGRRAAHTVADDRLTDAYPGELAA
jgi:hypothetical protein